MTIQQIQIASYSSLFLGLMGAVALIIMWFRLKLRTAVKFTYRYSKSKPRKKIKKIYENDETVLLVNENSTVLLQDITIMER